MKALTLDGFIDKPRDWATGIVSAAQPHRSKRPNGINRDDYYLLTVTPDDQSEDLFVISRLKRGATPAVRFYEIFTNRDGVILLKRCEPFALVPGRRIDYLVPREGESRIWAVISSRSSRFPAATAVGSVLPKRRQEDREQAVPTADNWFDSQS